MKVNIKVGPTAEHYAALANDEELFIGASPDEALGYAVREFWLRSVSHDLRIHLEYTDRMPIAEDQLSRLADLAEPGD